MNERDDRQKSAPYQFARYTKIVLVLLSLLDLPLNRIHKISPLSENEHKFSTVG
jgi:hypothetical protein